MLDQRLAVALSSREGVGEDCESLGRCTWPAGSLGVADDSAAVEVVV